jgi:cell division protein FtsW (lipid II flippase)
MTIIWGPVLLALLFVGGIPLRYLICIILIVRRLHPARDQSRA